MTDPTACKTWTEIHAQPDIWRAFAPELAAQASALQGWIASADATAVWFSGAGTSAYIGDLVAAALFANSPLPMTSVASTDLVAAPHQFIGPQTRPLVVNFGRSGNSTESIGVLNVLDALAPDTPRLNITCNPNGTLNTRSAPNQRVIALPVATHDQGFAMTSSYSTMMLTALGIFDPEPPSNALPRLADALEAALPRYRAMAEDLDTPKRFVITGSGALRFAAREMALKIMELSAGRIPVLWDSALGFRHGPKSFVAPGTHIICLTSADPTTALYDSDLAAELRQQFDDISLTVLPPSDLGDGWGAPLHVAFAQVLAVILSARMGLNVDDPFIGQGTLSRVVDGVTLYPPACAS